MQGLLSYLTEPVERRQAALWSARPGFPKVSSAILALTPGLDLGERELAFVCLSLPICQKE